MSSPLPHGLAEIERRLEATVLQPAPDLRERVLSAARAPKNLRALEARPRSLWLAASAAAAVLFLFNFARSASLELAPAHGPSRALCASLLRDADASSPFAKQLVQACPPDAAPAPIEE